jgi:hypothetical protein
MNANWNRQGGTIARTYLVIAMSCVAVYAEAPRAIEEKGHLSPLTVRITFTDGTMRKSLLTGIGFDNTYLTHVLGVLTDNRTVPRNLWLDNIQSIRGTDHLRRLTDEFVIELKDGKEIQASLAGGNSSFGCKYSDARNLNDGNLCKFLEIRSEDDGRQRIDLLNVKQVDFLPPARKDRAGNAMFDHWRYSPYTGEKLPQ